MIKKIANLLACSGLLFSFSFVQIKAAESEIDQPEENEQQSIIMAERGHVEGYLQLDVGNQKIDATLIPERLGKNYGGVLLLADKGEGIDDSGVINTLRQYLPDYGWSVMTIALDYPYQANILLSEQNSPKIDVNITPPDAEATADSQVSAESPQTNTEQALTDKASEGEEQDIGPDSQTIDNLTRIQTAITYFNQQTIPRLILIGHGEGTIEAINLLQADAQVAVALISIGFESDITVFTSVEGNTPILDVISADIGTKQIRTRKAEMKRMNKNYAQRVLVSSDSDFSSTGLALTTTIAGWMHKQFVDEDKI